jgi:hypothetical protein
MNPNKSSKLGLISQIHITLNLRSELKFNLILKDEIIKKYQF